MLNYIICLYLFITFVSSSHLEHDGWVNIKLEHTLQPNIFTNRGNITIQSLRSGQLIINQPQLTQDEKNQLKDLAIRNEFYQLRSIVSNDGGQNTFLSTVKACMLVEADLDDRISVSLDYTGRVIGVTLIIASTSTCEGADVPLSKLKEFTTSVYVRHTEVGPVPDTTSYVQKLEREREAKERGEVKDNRSFLAKYWMYIVPVVILMMLSSIANPDAAGGGSGGAR